MFHYKNTKTGAEFDSPVECHGQDWICVMPVEVETVSAEETTKPQPKPAKKTAKNGK